MPKQKRRRTKVKGAARVVRGAGIEVTKDPLTDPLVVRVLIDTVIVPALRDRWLREHAGKDDPA